MALALGDLVLPAPAIDAPLIDAAQAGDRGALDALLRRHSRSIERVCRRLCKDDAQLDDVIQETYLAIVRNLSSFRGDAGFLTWVYTIARTHRGRATRSAVRDRGRREALERVGSAYFGDDADLDDHVASRELGEALERALAPLAPIDRRILIMRDLEDRSAAEIADAVWLSVPAVKTRLHRARVFARSRLDGLRLPLQIAAA